MIKKVSITNAPKAIGPYSQAIIHNGLIYTSGQIAIDPKTQEFIDGDIEKQTKLVIKNLGNILSESGSDLTKAIKVTVYLKDLNDFIKVNSIYEKFFTGCPARSTVEVKKLPKDALIEIDCIAYI